MLNPRKPVKISNNTNYFDPSKDKVFNEFASPDSHVFFLNKKRGYQFRLYWEHKYCLDNNGQTFFYTLTYNNSNLPYFEGFPCFRYSDLVYLLNGGFKKQLLRKYGTNFKYFVGAELGEGAGSRGMANNPHYHVLFFLRPANDSRYPYIKINPVEFRSLIRHYWQGFDESKEGWHSYKHAKFGIVKEGDYVGLVNGYKAINYVSKYVLKDIRFKKFEKSYSADLTLKYDYELRDIEATAQAFYYRVLCPRYNLPVKPFLDDSPDFDYSSVEWLESPFELFSHVAPEHCKSYVNSVLTTDIPIQVIVHGIVSECNLLCEYRKFFESYVKEHVKESINYFRNNYTNKCRVSHGVGDYALRFITDPLHPVLTVPEKSGFKTYKLSLYYYRKLFTQVVKDVYGNPIRVLTPLGIEYKVLNLPCQIESLENKTRSYLSILNLELYRKIENSDINTNSSRFPYWKFKKLLNEYDTNLIINRYAVYKLVYEGRFFSLEIDRPSKGNYFPSIDPVSDFRRFLQPSYFTVSYSPERLDLFLESDCKGYCSFQSHPSFLPYLRFFSVFDNLSYYFNASHDVEIQERYEELKRVKKYHDTLQLTKFYQSKS